GNNRIPAEARPVCIRTHRSVSARISSMRVTIGQINTTNGDIAGNVERILKAIEQAKRDQSDLIVFPEITIQGYTSFDWFLDPDVVRSALEPLDEIIRATQGLTAIVGTIRPNDQPTGRKVFNSAAIIRDGRLLGFADKTLLPEYDVFDDPRYFQPGAERHLFSVTDRKLGVAVCEDFWNDKTFWRERLYANDPADELIELGAQVLISINASPFNKGKMGQRLGMPVVAHPISNAYETLRAELSLPSPSVENRSVASENLQSRLRGNILMTISNSENRLLLSTGNKSELALGYCTLYGDTN